MGDITSSDSAQLILAAMIQVLMNLPIVIVAVIGIFLALKAVAYWLDFVTERFTNKPKRGRINLSWVQDAKLEDLLDKQRGQLKLDERLQTVKQIEELVAEEQYEIYFSTDTRTYFWDKDIANYRPTAWFPYTHVMKTWRDKEKS